MDNFKRNNEVYWIWGLFSGKENDFLNNIKEEVQDTLKSPNFQCHITLSGPFEKVDKKFLNKFKELKVNNFSIPLKVNGYNYKKEEFESFFISIKNTKELTNLREKIYELKKFKFQRKYSPHISLAYGNHETSKKHFLISKLPKLPIFLRVSRLSLVEVNESKNLWNIIEIF